MFGVAELRSSFMFLLAVLAICSFCGKDFKSLGSHSWRCNKKSSFNTGEGFNRNQRLHDQTESIIHDDFNNIGISHSPSTCNHVKCSCGHVYKGLRGLKMHQRNFRVIKDLASETFEFVQDDLIGSYNNDDSIDDLNHTIRSSLPNIKPGVKLPRSDDQWTAANLHFMVSLLSCGIKSSNITDAIKLMNSTVYNFKDKFGYSEDFISDQLINKYKDMPKRWLKVSLKFLNSPRPLPTKLGMSLVYYVILYALSMTFHTLNLVTISGFKTTFGIMTKSKLDSSTSSSPSFSMSTCTNFFHDFCP